MSYHVDEIDLAYWKFNKFMKLLARVCEDEDLFERHAAPEVGNALSYHLLFPDKMYKFIDDENCYPDELHDITGLIVTALYFIGRDSCGYPWRSYKYNVMPYVDTFFNEYGMKYNDYPAENFVEADRRLNNGNKRTT